MLTRRLAIVTVIAVLFALCAPLVRSHEFKLDAVVNTFVKIEPTEAHVVVRAPLYLFKNVRFPVKAAEVDIQGSSAALERALTLLQQDVALLEDGRALTARRAVGRLALPSDRSFESFDEAVRHVATPIDPDTHIVIDQGYVDAHLVYPIRSADAVFALRSSVAPELGEYLKIAVRYRAESGESRSMVLRGGVGTVDLNPTWISAAASFVAFGVAHIVTGLDHLLFLLCLVIPLRGVRQLLTVITGFTLAHSFTLIGSAFGLAPQGPWFAPFVEVVIAVSIIYMALENIIGVDIRRRVLLTVLFGLVHGFGFSYGLKEDLQFAGSHLLVSLFAFNLGIEFGQILVLAVMLPALAIVTRYLLPGRLGVIILAALVAHVGWHWMIDRWEALARQRWPVPDLASLPVLLFWIAGLAVAASAVMVVVARLRLEGTRAAGAPRDAAANSSAAE
jgi:hypothetical protein